VNILKRFFQGQFWALKRNRKTTLILAAIFCALVIAAILAARVEEVSNPTGSIN